MADNFNELIARRHPEYDTYKSHWDFLESCYAGGREWFADNIFKYLKEGDEEFSARVERAYRFNHTRELVDLVSKYIFKAPVIRNEKDASPAVSDFWKHSTLGGANIEQYIRQLSTKSSLFGRIWVVVDSSMTEDVATIAEERKGNARVYSYAVTPQNALDMSYDDRGELLWILIHETVRDDEDPFESSGAESSQYRLWMRNEWYLLADMSATGEDPDVQIVESGEHGMGVVPVFYVDHITTDESKYTSPSLVADTAYMDRAVANYLSNLDAIIQDQTFSQLAIPAQGIMPGDDKHDPLIETGTKRIFTYDGEGGAKPFFISPDPKQAELIMVAVKQIVNEIYHTVGMAGERTKQDNSEGIDNSSGVAKAYDFERMNALLTSKAGRLEDAENTLVTLVNLWAGQQNKSKERLVGYSETFDTRDLYDEFDIAEKLQLIEAPDEVRRSQMEVVIDKLLPHLSEAEKKKLKAATKNWPVEPVMTDTSSAFQKSDDGVSTQGAQDNEQRT